MELAVELVSGKKFRPIEAHLKSKALHGSETRAPKTPKQFQSQLLWQDASFTFGCDNLNRPLLIISLRLSFLSEHCAEWFIHERHLGFTVGISCGAFCKTQANSSSDIASLHDDWILVSTLNDSLDLAAKFRPDSTKNPFKSSKRV